MGVRGVEEPAAGFATNKADLKVATVIRNLDANGFVVEEKELGGVERTNGG